MKKCILISGLILLLCLCMTACACEHEWKEADCEVPRMCVRCEETQGDPLGHVWADATCAAPVTCRDCGKTRGEPLPHTWAEATCLSAKTCQVCGETEGDIPGHTPGEWEFVDFDVRNLVYSWVRHCTVCQELAEEETVTLNATHEDGIFLINSREILSRMYMLMNETHTVSQFYCIEYNGIEGSFSVRQPDSLYNHATLYVSDGTNLIPLRDWSSVYPRKLIFECYNTDHGMLACMVLPAVVDPTLTWETGGDLIQQALDSPNGTLERNGIRYTAEKKNGMIHVVIELV